MTPITAFHLLFEDLVFPLQFLDVLFGGKGLKAMLTVPFENFTSNFGLNARCIFAVLAVVQHAHDGQGWRKVVLIETFITCKQQTG